MGGRGTPRGTLFEASKTALDLAAVGAGLGTVLERHHDALPADWIDGAAMLIIGSTPPGISSARWSIMLANVARFLESWGADAARLGWQTHELFGVHIRAPLARFDHMGLVPVLAGRRIADLSADGAVIETVSSARLIYRRRPRPPSREQCLLWHLNVERVADDARCSPTFDAAA